MQKYQHYVSLGYNCEIAFQFRRLLGLDSSSFFSWNITPFRALQSLLKSGFSGILAAENLRKHGDGSLVWDKSHEFAFHSPFSTPEPHDDPNFAEQLEAFRKKTKYLIDKFVEVAHSGETVAYFYKTEEADAHTAAVALRFLLDEYHQGRDNYTLILLQTADRAESDWGEARIANRYLKRFGPWHDATDGHVQSYDKVFREFPHVDTMRLAGY
jgi:hypothetical protein